MNCRVARWLSLLFILGVAEPAFGCGPDTDCQIGDRTYRIDLPDSQTSGQTLPAILFAHGYRGSAQGVMRNSSLRNLANELGAALIALDALGDDWTIPGSPSHSRIAGTDEIAYVDAVLLDITAKFAINPDRIMATGFSAGGMLVWNLACQMGDRFAGLAPIAGTFWRSVPVDCPAPPASLIHLHGSSDQIVPMQGRAIGDTFQGDVNQAIAMYAAHGGFEPAGIATFGQLTCSLGGNPAGQILDLCLFEDGHSFRTEFVGFAWDRLGINE